MDVFISRLQNSVGGRVLQHLRQTYGWDARLVGGAVRDTYLELPHVKDWDLAVAADPQSLREVLQAWVGPEGRVCTYGLSHGVVSASWQSNRITFSACRADITAREHRYADVAYGEDWDADARRRDFTCNAIYFDGTQVWDPYSGCADLQQRLVRFIGDPHQRIDEDILRFWRFFRFWAHVGNAQEVDLSQHVKDLSRLSPERTQQEIRLLMQGPYRQAPLRELIRLGVIPLE